MSTFDMRSLPDDDPRKIFFHLEDDILSVVEYIAVLEAATRSELLANGDDEKGAYRLILKIQDHAYAIKHGFKVAFPSDQGAS